MGGDKTEIEIEMSPNPVQVQSERENKPTAVKIYNAEDDIKKRENQGWSTFTPSPSLGLVSPRKEGPNSSEK